MRRWIALLYLALSFPVFHTQAQEENWYFGWNSDSGQVVAYTPTGTLNPLVTAEEILPYAWRLSPASALAVLSVEGAYGLYHLTATTSVPLTADTEIQYANLRTLAARHENTAVLLQEQGATGVGLLVDLNAGTIITLGQSYITLDTWRFSADGTQLRYLRQNGAPTEWVIIERTLATNEERIIFTLTSPYPTLEADTYGENWLYRVVEGDTGARVLRHTLIKSDGTTQLIAEEPVTEPVTDFTVYHLLNEQLLTFNAPCSGGCLMELRTLAGEPLQTFSTGNINSPQVIPLAQLAPDRLLLMIDNEFWLIKAGSSAWLGVFDGRTMQTPAAEMLSPDQHWLVVADSEASTFQLLDLQTETALYEGENTTSLTADYDATGLLIRQGVPARTLFYPYGAAEVIALPGDAFYFEVLADGSLLYAQTTADDERTPGIYRYDPQQQTYAPIAEGIFPVVMD